MPDYKEMYLKMIRATEKAMQTLIQAQQECEELYLSSEAPQLCPLPAKPEKGITGQN